MGGAERCAYRVCEWQRQQIEPSSESDGPHAAERPMFLRTSSREARLRLAAKTNEFRAIRPL